MLIALYINYAICRSANVSFSYHKTLFVHKIMCSKNWLKFIIYIEL